MIITKVAKIIFEPPAARVLGAVATAGAGTEAAEGEGLNSNPQDSQNRAASSPSAAYILPHLGQVGMPFRCEARHYLRLECGVLKTGLRAS